MSLKGSYAAEKFWQALDVLVTGPDKIQTRLAGAAQYIIRLSYPATEVPREIAGELEEIIHALTHIQADGEEGSIAATTSCMTEKAGEIAGKILEVYQTLNENED